MFAYYLDLALRSLKRTKALTTLMIVAIALGIGASMTMLTVLHVLSGDPLPGRSSMLYAPQLDPRDMGDYQAQAEPPDQVTWIDGMNLLQAKRADHQALMTGGSVAIQPAQSALDPFYETARYTTADFFPLFGVPTDYFRQDASLAWLLFAVCVAMLLVTAVGIAGLANFWVQQRRRQIGIRRALGATRSDILRYFQIENFLIVSGGIVFGMLLTLALNLLLTMHYELPRLPIVYLPIGALALWLIGQAAVLGPALRAAAVPPVVATRSL